MTDASDASVGVWLIGARGNIATTAIVGALAAARDQAPATGLVTASEPCSRLDLPALDDLVFGGHDVRTRSLTEAARQLQADGGLGDREVLERVADDLAGIDDRIRPGTVRNCGEAVEALADPAATIEGGPAVADGSGAAEVVGERAEQRGEDGAPIDGDLADPAADGDDSAEAIVERVRSDYAAFVDEHDLDELVVVNVASTEPPIDEPAEYDSRASVERAVEADDPQLPASTLYAYAALVEGHPYANFTPSTGAALAGTRELAREEDVPHMGNDGKTGESLVKAALAPLFAGRNLRVRAWEAHNVLGNTDGQVLEDEANEAGKLESKGGVLEGVLDGPDHERVRIDHTPSLGDWKTAWDYVHFEGFLGTEMTMQFTWEGSDSALAAPLVLDLARLLAHADERGEAGVQPHLASFFKAPLAVDEHALGPQLELLEQYANEHAGDGAVEPTTVDD